jgi:hypothetical protein
MVDFLGGRARDDQLIDLARSRRQYRVDIQVGPADLAVGLNGQHPSQEIKVFGILFCQCVVLDLIGKHSASLELT